MKFLKRLMALILAINMAFSGAVPAFAFELEKIGEEISFSEAETAEPDEGYTGEVFWEQGTITAATGIERDYPNVVRNKGYLELSDYSGITLNSGHCLTYFVYDKDYNYLGNGKADLTANFLLSGEGISTKEMLIRYPEGVYFRIALWRGKNGEMAVDMIPDSGIRFYDAEYGPVIWEMGSIYAKSGITFVREQVIRCISYLPVEDYVGVGIGKGYAVGYLAYDENLNYLGNGNPDKTGYFVTNGFYTEDITENYPEAKYMKLIFREDPIADFTMDAVEKSGIRVYKTGEDFELPEPELKATNIMTMNGCQDGAVYNKKVFLFNNSGNCNVYDVETKTKIGSFTVDKVGVLNPHANSVCFGNEFYAEGDKYPLLYVNIYNNYWEGYADKKEGTCCVYRITEENGVFGCKLVQVIKIGFTDDYNLWNSAEDNGYPYYLPYGNFVVDTDGDKLWAFVLRNGEEQTRFLSFDLPEIGDGVYSETYGCNLVTLESTDIIKMFDTEHLIVIQGCCYYGGKILSVTGLGKGTVASPFIQVIDPEKGEIEKNICFEEIGITNEPEMISVDPMDGTIYYASVDGILRRLEINTEFAVLEGWKAVPVSVNEKSGHLAYKIEDGVLTFRDFGNSSMEDYGRLPDYSNMSRENPTDCTIAEWYQRRKEITKVVFDETISCIGSYVLTNMNAVAEIRIENPEAEVVRNAVLLSTTARETPLDIFAASTVKTADYWIRGNGNRKISVAIANPTLYYTDLENYAEMLNECEKNLISAEQISIEMLCEAVELISKIPQNNYSVSDYESTVYGAESAVVLLRKISSGTCGEGVFYNLEVSEKTGKLRLNITGTGSMNSYETENDVPWHEIMDSIGEVAIGEEISGFDAKAFPEDAVYKLCLNSEAFEFAEENGFDIKIEKLRILCIGNSHTADYSGFIGNILADMENAGLETEITISRAQIGSIGLYSGRNSNVNATYRSHLEAINNKTGAYNYLAKNRYDLVIVQDYMESVVDSPEVFKAGIVSFIGKVKEIASGNGKGEPQVAWFADWVDIRSTGGDTALRDGEGNRISLEVLSREEVYAKSLANIAAVEKAIAEKTANMPDFVIHGSTFKQNAMSSYFGTTKLFDKSDFCILERDTTHLTYELGRYLFAAGVVSEILDNYSEILITENGKIDVGAALSAENGPSAEGEGSQYSGAVNGDVLAVIREVIASPDEFRQSVYTVDPVDAFIEKASGINWNPEGVSGEEEILGALAEQIGSLCGNEIESFGLSMAEYESENDYTVVLRATHGYSIIEKKFTVHNHVYEAAVTPPTCTEQGYTTYTCGCGESYVGDYVEAAGHSFENGICTVCGEWEYPMGDINLDGEVNVKDAYYARLVAAKLIKPTDEQLLVGDADLDGRITALDANIIRKFVAKIIGKLPVTG